MAGWLIGCLVLSYLPSFVDIRNLQMFHDVVLCVLAFFCFLHVIGFFLHRSFFQFLFLKSFLFFLPVPHFHSRVFIYLNECGCRCPLRWTDRLPYCHNLRIISEPERMRDRRQKTVNAFAGCTVRTAGSSRITAHQGYQYGSGMLILVQVGRNLK